VENYLRVLQRPRCPPCGSVPSRHLVPALHSWARTFALSPAPASAAPSPAPCVRAPVEPPCIVGAQLPRLHGLRLARASSAPSRSRTPRTGACGRQLSSAPHPRAAPAHATRAAPLHPTRRNRRSGPRARPILSARTASASHSVPAAARAPTPARAARQRSASARRRPAPRLGQPPPEPEPRRLRRRPLLRLPPHAGTAWSPSRLLPPGQERPARQPPLASTA
jgi:hypothetical protein